MNSSENSFDSNLFVGSIRKFKKASVVADVGTARKGSASGMDFAARDFTYPK